MFTGIISEMGKVTALRKKGEITHLYLKSKEILKDARIGDSISVNGTCLTLVEIKGDTMRFDLSTETLRSSNLGLLKVGDLVNLEPSLRSDSRLGGHFVSGHVDETGIIKSKTKIGEIFKIEIEVSENTLNFLIKKGSVAVDGISLTVVDILRKSFTVVIIPHTAKITTLGLKGPGDTVNIEIDMIGKYVARFLGMEKKDSGLMKTLLKEKYIK
ncbi:MAG: riboflavin synthase [Nitrospirae bacterium]|nr:riboflavin synthase [Nitrospirota bacterium]